MPLGSDREIVYRTTVKDATAQGVNSTVQSLSRVDEAFGRIEKRESEVDREAQQLRKSFERVARSADPLARAQKSYNRDLAVAKKALREGAASAEEYDRAVRGLNQKLERAERYAKGSNTQFAALGKTLRVAAAAAAALGVSFSGAALGREAVNTAAAFEQQMANVSAVTGALGEDLKALSREARDLGASTVFSASEAAAGMENLGRAGFSTREIMASTAGTLDLAAAGQLGLARAAEISSGVLRGFNLEASESGRVADVLASASVQSNQQIEDLGEAMKFAAPTAKLFGVSLEEATASIAKLADAGIKGGIGGRGFQALVTRLEKNRDDIEAIIGDFDLAEEGLTSVLRRLGEANISNATAIEIFSAENLDIFSVLGSAATDAANGTDRLTESLKNATGEARRISQIQFDTFKGALDELGGAREELSIEFADAGALEELETTVRSITEAMRSEEARAFARAIGEDVAGALKAVRENWGAIESVTKAATAAAIAYGVATGAGALAKTITTIRGKIAVQVAANAADRAAALAALDTAKAEAAATAASLARARAVQATAVVVAGSTTAEFARAAALKQITALETANAAATARLAAAQAGLATSSAASAAALGRTVAQMTGLSGAFALISNPVTGIPIALGAATAALVVYRKDIAEAVAGTRDLGAAARATGAVLGDYFESALSAVGLSMKEIAETASAAVTIVGNMLPRGVVDGWREFADVLDRVTGALESIRKYSPQNIGIAIGTKVRNDIRAEVERIENSDAARRAEQDRQRASNSANALLGGASLDSEIAGVAGEYKNLSAALLAFNADAAAAGLETRKLAEEHSAAGDAAKGQAEAEAKLTERIADQRSAIQGQIDKLRQLNEARGRGLGDNELALFERRIEARERYDALSQEEFDRLFEQLEAEREINEIYDERASQERDLAEARERAAQDAAAALQREQQRFADAATDLFVDIWRSFRREGESAIDVIKRHFENALDNIVGGFFQNIFDQAFGRGGFGGGFSINGIAGPVSAATSIPAAGSITNALSGAPSIGLSGPGLSFSGVAPVAGFGPNPYNIPVTAAPGAGGGGFLGLTGLFGGVDRGLNRISEALANPIENLLGLNGSQGLALRGALKGAGTGLLVSQGVNLLGSLVGFNRGNTGSTVGGTVGGVLGSVIPGIGNVLGSIIGSAAGKIFGSLVGGKPSNEAAGGQLDLATFTTSNTFAKKGNEENIQTRDLILEQTGSILQQISQITGGTISGGLVVTAGKRDIAVSRGGVTERVEAGDVDGAVQAALDLAIRGLKGGEAALVSLAKAMVRAGADAEKVTGTLAKLSEVLNIGKEPPSQFAEALKTVREAFSEARAAAGQYAAELKSLAGDQLNVTRAVGKAFDDDIARQTRSLSDPLQQQAIDLAKQQRVRIEDAQAISAAVEEAAKAAGKSVAQALAESQQRLGAVLDLNTEEWKAFVEQAAGGADGVRAASEALSLMREEMLGLGVDLATVEAQIADVRGGLAAAFDAQVATELRAITAPQEAAALDLIARQADRIEAARSLSGDAADEQARLSRVLELNTAEWRQFIDQAAASPEALAAAADAIEAFAARADELGADPALLRRQVSDARATLAAEIDQDTAQRLLNIANPALAQFNQLLKEQQDRLRVARLVGANVGGAERLNALERQKFLEGLSDEDRIGLGDFLGVIEDVSGRMSFVLSDLRLAFESQITHVERLTQSYEESEGLWKSANDNLRSSLGDLRREFRGGNLDDQLNKALQRFDSAFATATQPAANDNDRTAAQNELGALGREAASLARQAFGTAPQFQSIFDRIESRIVAAIGEGVEVQDEAARQAQIARDSLDALRRIDNALAQPSLDIPILEESRNTLLDINDGQTVFTERLEELIALERQRAANAQVTVQGLSSIDQPLTSQTGDPVADSAVAQQIASAVLQSGNATVAAIAASDGAEDDRNQELVAAVNRNTEAVEALVSFLRRIYGDEGALAA